MPRGVWVIAVLLVTIGGSAPLAAQPLSPADLPPPAPTSERPRASSSESSDVMPSFLDSPVRISDTPTRRRVEPPLEAPPSSTTIPAGFLDDQPREPRRTRPATLTPPSSARPVSADRIESVGKVEPASAKEKDDDPVNDLLNNRRTPPTKEKDAERSALPFGERLSGKFSETLEAVLGHRTEWFKSDHTFDNFASPVTNPFLFEDPRSLTELRPIFIYQRIPDGQHDFLGGNVSFFGTQARVAITDRWSFTINKLGGIWINPSKASPIGDDGGFAELWLGPKYTFIRNEEAGRVMAGGLLFQVPVGSGGVYQHTGTLSLTPYVSYAENFGRDWRFGGINVMANTGYSLSTNRERSDYWYISGHVDWDVGNYHRIYPLAELNYYLYTTNGTSTPIGSEGRDLINFGGAARGNNMMTLAFGARGKLAEAAQIGAAFEFPIAGNRDLFRYRFTVDFIWRY